MPPGSPRADAERRLGRAFELAEELVTLKLALEAELREGRLDIAAARYARPSNPISRTQYDLTMEARTRVELSARGEDARPRARFTHFELVDPDAEASPDAAATDRAASTSPPADERRRVVPRGETTTRSPDAIETIETIETSASAEGLRRRGAPTPSSPRRESEPPEQPTDRVVSSRTRRMRRPVHWFGAMPPPQLRRAEARFRRAAALVAEVATATAELRALTGE
jgi:hypothetical protein